METEIIDLKETTDNAIFEKLKNYYLENKLIAIPTETVYGLSADATSDTAVNKIYSAKGRPSDNPLIVHFYETKQLEGIVSFVDEKVKTLIDHFWPGAMTLILNLENKDRISKYVTAGLDTLAVRMPSNSIAREILQKTEVLLAAPSANTSGKPSPTKFEHVYNDLNGKIDAIVAGESSTIGLESTVIDCTKFPFVIARPGSISASDIENVLGKGSVVYNEEVGAEKPIAPGMKYRHYSPEAELIIVEEKFENFVKKLSDKDKTTGFITYGRYREALEDLDVSFKFLAEDEEDIEQCNKNLYNILREYDKEDVKIIYILNIKETEKSKALVNRIAKASSKK